MNITYFIIINKIIYIINLDILKLNNNEFFLIGILEENCILNSNFLEN
jgi:hypothetical protein